MSARLPPNSRFRPARWFRSGGAGGREGGMTLIEVMVGFTLVGILLLGMDSLWVTVNAQMDRQVLRQKAVFRLNGEMERLNYLYREGTGTWVLPSTLGETENSTGYDNDALVTQRAMYIEDPTERWVYTTACTGCVTFVETDGGANFTDAITSSTTATEINSIYGKIYVSDNDADARRNYVWLDRSRSLVGRLSWELANSTSTSASTNFTGSLISGACYSGTKCAWLTLYLDYPFRVDVDTASGTISNVREIAAMPVETLTVQTIVGARR